MPANLLPDATQERVEFASKLFLCHLERWISTHEGVAREWTSYFKVVKVDKKNPIHSAISGCDFIDFVSMLNGEFFTFLGGLCWYMETSFVICCKWIVYQWFKSNGWKVMNLDTLHQTQKCVSKMSGLLERSRNEWTLVRDSWEFVWVLHCETQKRTWFRQFLVLLIATL